MKLIESLNIIRMHIKVLNGYFWAFWRSILQTGSFKWALEDKEEENPGFYQPERELILSERLTP